jgi:HEPN domain-containing protein
MVQNSTFRAGITEFNACVGNNGNPDLKAYADGFLEAARNLVHEIVINKNTIKNDTWVYPIIFNARHGLELVLKGVLQRLPGLRKSVFIDLSEIKTHDIGSLWKEISIKTIQIDRRYEPIIKNISSHIEDYIEIDPSAETFRYPRDQSQNKHLDKTPLINLGIFYSRFHELTDLLDQLFFLTEHLQEEYALGTFTTQLSRKDLENISKKLPKRDQWKDDSFTKISHDIQNEFGIGKNQYSTALKTIQAHPTFASWIGVPIPLQHATTAQFLLFTEQWRLIHPKREYTESLGHNYIEDAAARFASYQADAEVKKNALKTLLTIPVLALAEIGAIYQLGKERTYSERYPQVLSVNLAGVNNFKNETDAFNFIHHYLSKTNFQEFLIAGLLIMGQQESVEKIKSI